MISITICFKCNDYTKKKEIKTSLSIKCYFMYTSIYVCVHKNIKIIGVTLDTHIRYTIWVGKVLCVLYMFVYGNDNSMTHVQSHHVINYPGENISFLWFDFSVFVPNCTESHSYKLFLTILRLQ